MSEQILCASIENITENHDIYRSFSMGLSNSRKNVKKYKINLLIRKQHLFVFVLTNYYNKVMVNVTNVI